MEASSSERTESTSTSCVGNLSKAKNISLKLGLIWKRLFVRSKRLIVWKRKTSNDGAGDDDEDEEEEEEEGEDEEEEREEENSAKEVERENKDLARRPSTKLRVRVVRDLVRKWTGNGRRRRKGVPKDVPKGHIGVYVGGSDEELTRYVIPVAFLNHPMFLSLLRETQEFANGFHHEGAFTIPCEISDFEYVHWLIQREFRSSSSTP